ncbi:MAG TPA: amidase family protein, partial [Burkholderiaceae bacterium]|nr:amidase family protein [Burkholderiaceae bacterium]
MQRRSRGGPVLETSELHYLEIGEVARLLSSRQVSAVELAQQMLRRIGQVDPTLKSYARVTPDLALAQAKEADRMLGRRQILSQLHGVPIAVKDL